MGYIGAGISRFNTADGLSINADGPTVTGIKDEDNMASNSAVKLATQQSIKAYVDSQVGANNELSEVLANGNTTGGNNIAFADNDKAVFGASSDLQIYHDGLNSYVRDAGTGNLRITSDSEVHLAKHNNEYMVRAYADGAVNLYYDGGTYTTPKLATTSGGIDVTGTVTADGLTVQDASAGRVLTGIFQNTTNAAGTSSGISLRNSADTTSVNLTAERVGSNAGADLVITGFDNAGVEKNFMRITEGNDISFYDSTGVTQGLFWDASAESLGIGTNSPISAFDTVGKSMFGDSVTTYTNIISGNSQFQPTMRIARNTTDSAITIERFNNAAGGPFFHFGKGRSTTIGDFSTIVQNNDILGQIVFSGADGDQFRNAATIRAEVDGTPGNDDMPGRIVFATTSDGSQSVSERMRIDSSGNVGIGTSSPSGALNVHNASGDTNMYITSGTTTASTTLFFGDSASTTQGRVQYDHNNDSMRLHTAGAESMRINSSGSLLVGKTGESLTTTGHVLGVSGYLWTTRDDNIAHVLNRTTSDGTITQFRKEGTTVGSISVTGSGTTYNTTSDIRLKTDIEPIDHATDMLMAMNPVSHRWKANPDADAVVGFIAQEMQEIVPEAVSKGDSEDDMWSMDYGRITPVLVAALQDAVNEIKTLKERVAELEAK